MTSYLKPYIQESAHIDIKSIDKYVLTIQYSLDGLSFIIFDETEHKFLCLKHYTISESGIPLKALLDELEERESWKIEHFHKANLLLDNKDNTLIPNEFYQKETSRQFLKLLQPTSSDAGSDIIYGNDIRNIYPISDDIIAGVEETSRNMIIRHASTIFINKLIKEFSERQAETRAFVSVKNNYYELAILNNERVIFHNYFNFNTKEDFLYFILFTFEQLKIDNESTPLYFMGFIENNSSIVNLCSRYIRNIRFINRDNELKFSNELDSIPFYYYYTLYNSVTCE